MPEIGEDQAPQGVGARWRQALRSAPLGEPALLVALALVTGLAGGVGAVAFRLMIRYCRWFFVNLLVDRGFRFAGPAQPYLLILTPVLGLLAVGVISNHFAREVRGHGVPQILEALALRRGRIRPRVGLFGILAPAITIGARGSVGREGPIALIGAAFGSSLGQLLRLGDQYTSLLLACGAAAGIGATFNAPIAGALFGLEVVLGSWAMGALVPVFVASVTGVTMFNALWGDNLVLPSPAYHFVHPFSPVLMLLLGLLAGGVALAYTRGLHLLEEISERWKTPWPVQAVTGGLIVGLLGLALPRVLGVGYASMSEAVLGHFGLGMLVALLLGKYVATLVTIGAGGSGGVFAPSLYLGVMLGGAFGLVAHALLPTLAASAPLYAVAGMGAVFAGAAQAPLTATVIILEMTGDYHLTIGVMAACAVSYLVYGSLARDSMYTVKLSQRGVRILRGAEVRPLQVVPVTAALTPLGPRLWADESVAQALHMLQEAQVRALPVFTRQDGHLLGVVDSTRLLEAVSEQRLAPPVGDLVRAVPVLSPRLTLDDAMRRFALLHTELLPVGASPADIVGTVTRDDVLRAYYDRTVLTLETQHRVELLREIPHEEGTFREVHLPERWPGAGSSVAEMGLPSGVVVVAVHRGQQVLIPRGETLLAAEDGVLLYAGSGEVAERAEASLLGAQIRRHALMRRVTLTAGSPGVGRRVRELGLPAGVLLSAVERQQQVLIPTGDTALAPGDVLTLRAASTPALQAAELLLAPAEEPGPTAAQNGRT